MQRYSFFGLAPVRRLMLGSLVILCVSTRGSGHAAVLLLDSFGYEPITTNGSTRYDSASNAVAIFLTHDLSGLRAELPNTGTEVWTASRGHQVQTWGSPA